MIGYSNLSNLLSIIKFFDEFKTNKLEISINILKKFENSSLTKLSKNIFSVLFVLLKMIAIVVIIISEDKLKIKLKMKQVSSLRLEKYQLHDLSERRKWELNHQKAWKLSILLYKL